MRRMPYYLKDLYQKNVPCVQMAVSCQRISVAIHLKWNPW